MTTVVRWLLPRAPTHTGGFAQRIWHFLQGIFVLLLRVELYRLGDRALLCLYRVGVHAISSLVALLFFVVSLFEVPFDSVTTGPRNMFCRDHSSTVDMEPLTE